MKKIFLILLTFSSISFSGDYIDDTIAYLDAEIETEKSLKAQNALIKSTEDLSYFSKIEYINFPLNYLTKANKQIFVDSLTFSKKGLSSFNYQVLNELNDFDKIYKILSLFGQEKGTYNVLNAYNMGGSTTGGIGVDGYIKNSKCMSRATCKSENDYQCIIKNC